MTDENKIQTNKVDRTMNGAFCAFWHGQMAYENGRVKRFETEHAAWEFLASCDAAGKIIHCIVAPQLVAFFKCPLLAQSGHTELGAKIAERHVRCSGGLRASITFSSSTIRAGKGRA